MSGQKSGGPTGAGPSRELPASLKAAAALAGPTKPLLRPVWRSALPVALGAATAIGGIVALGQRPDAAALGNFTVWGPVLVRVLAAAWLIGMSLRESSPSEGGTELARMAASMFAPLVVVGSAEWLSERANATGFGHVGGLACYPISVGLALPAVGLVAWLVARGYPLRPAFAGACGGLGAGLLADAAMHATCPAVSRAHTLLVHGGALVTVGLVGALVAVVSTRRRSRR